METKKLEIGDDVTIYSDDEIDFIFTKIDTISLSSDNYTVGTVKDVRGTFNLSYQDDIWRGIFCSQNNRNSKYIKQTQDSDALLAKSHKNKLLLIQKLKNSLLYLSDKKYNSLLDILEKNL